MDAFSKHSIDQTGSCSGNGCLWLSGARAFGGTLGSFLTWRRLEVSMNHFVLSRTPSSNSDTLWIAVWSSLLREERSTSNGGSMTAFYAVSLAYPWRSPEPPNMNSVWPLTSLGLA